MVERVVMGEMVERVARAIAARPNWNGLSAEAQDDWRAAARAAITAMREPTDLMRDVAKGYLTLQPRPHGRQDWYNEEVCDIWRAMIRTALED